ncbi:amidohydrolase [Streptohalobacillus salinus]|uniref:Amidohydrolase n=1 Tax=Streptohalobacillus salinus TaxID=621096 RepID=A0A2V3WRW6_9BACI|nr:amidohydrolase [Streptohalobacillus salinus]PXW91449.1 amidohydrolase [Streptohalobacillus salinus]
MIEQLLSAVDQAYDEMVEIRRFLHQHPELSFKEEQTQKYIADYYQRLNITHQTHVGGYGVVATIEGAGNGPHLAFRADFDALPIQDQKAVDYRSTVAGVMHACGHDGHTAILLVTAKILHQHKHAFNGKITFIHQPAEELAPGGAKPMIEAGCLTNVDYVFGTHLWSGLPVGTVHTSKEAFMAGADRFEITINGVGGHGAMPQETKDATVIGAALISQLQQIVSRRLNPIDTAVLTVGTFHSGSAFNVISGEAKLEGTVRTFNDDVQRKIISEMEAIIAGMDKSYGVTTTFNYTTGYPPVINHPNEAATAIACAKKVDTVTDARFTTPTMTGEDFSYYLHEKPGAFFFTGAQIENNFYPHHHPRFDFDERAMSIAAKTFMQLVDHYLMSTHA